MPKFVVTLLLPTYYTDEFTALIPSHWSYVSQLIDERVIEVYAISADRSRGWVTLNGPTDAAVRALVAKMPLSPFFTGINVDELFVYDSVASRFPLLSPN